MGRRATQGSNMIVQGESPTWEALEGTSHGLKKDHNDWCVECENYIPGLKNCASHNGKERYQLEI